MGRCAKLPPVSRNARLALLALSALLLIFPLTLGKPGLPPTLKADEPAYFLMGLSLARDGDLTVEAKDIDRLFDDFPYPPIRNLIVMTEDGWNTVVYSKPLVYSLFAAPFAHLFGANGFLFFNQMMVVAMIWMGTLYLRRFNSDGLSVLFSTCFVLLSVGYAYAFWIHPEIFNMAAVCLACFAAFRATEATRGWAAPAWIALSGVAMALAGYSKPIYAPIGVLLLLLAWRAARWRGIAGLAAGGGLVAVVVVWLAVSLQGPMSPYLGGHQRRALSICEPGAVPVRAAPLPTVAADRDGGGGAPARARRAPKRRNWGFLLGKPLIGPRQFFENVRYFLWGRHTGFLLYLPFGALCILLLALEAPRDGPRWVLLGTLTAIAAYTLLYIPINWQGGGGFVGNRYFVGVYPAFLFLLNRIRPSSLVVPTTAVASLFLIPILATPFGKSVAFPTMQAHVRNVPYRYFPLEFSLKNVPGYRKERVFGGRFIVRKDQALVRDRLLWLRGGDRVEVWYEVGEPLKRPVFLVKSHADDNDIEIRVNGTRKRIDHAAKDVMHRIELADIEPTRSRVAGENKSYIYKFVVESKRGAIQIYTQHSAARHCGVKVGEQSVVANFYSGLEFALLGEAEIVDRDLSLDGVGRVHGALGGGRRVGLHDRDPGSQHEPDRLVPRLGVAAESVVSLAGPGRRAGFTTTELAPASPGSSSRESGCGGSR